MSSISILYGLSGSEQSKFAAEVAWELPEGPFVYWRGEVTAYTTKPAPCT